LRPQMALLTVPGGEVRTMVTKRVISTNVDGHRRRGRLKKRWKDYVKDDMRIKIVRMEMTSDRREWNKKTCCADPTSGIRG
jgi:hypothetical protein